VPHKFITQADLQPADLKPNDMDFSRLSVLSHPSTTGTKHPTILAVSVLPGKGHDFRYHPNREEVIHVLAGTIEVWVERKKRILGPGTACSCLLGSCTAPSTRARTRPGFCRSSVPPSAAWELRSSTGPARRPGTG
jgi:hypothetical protein